MLLRSGAQELSYSSTPIFISTPLSSSIHTHTTLSLLFTPSMRHSLSSSLRSLSLFTKSSKSISYFHPHRTPTLFTPTNHLLSFSSSSKPFSSAPYASSTGVEEKWEFGSESNELDVAELKKLASPVVEVKELEELPEQWRRSKIAWLCKELPSHKPATLIRILNAQRKWIAQENAMYIAVHFMRIRENEASFRVYKWMMQQHWYRFDFDFATKLADYMGKERKFTKCREIFNNIINQGCVPSESTFHILTVAYLSSPIQGCLEEACGIFNRMIQFGAYKPRLSLHNSLFKALVSKPGGTSKYYLKQAEFVYHNMVTSGLDVSKNIYAGLIWLHSYQDVIDTERIVALRGEMKQVGVEEEKDVLVSILRAYSKQGDVEEVEKTWLKLLRSDCSLPSQAFVHRMEVYAKVGEPTKSLEVFRAMQGTNSTNVVAYHKIIEVMCEAQEIEIAESLVNDFVKSGMKPLIPAYVELMNMYLKLNLHEKLEAIFTQYLEKCQPNRAVFNIYLESLVRLGNHNKAMEIFNQMYSNGAIGVNSRSCNTILSGYLSSGQYIEAEKIYDLMCLKKYDIDPSLMEKLDFVLSLSRKSFKKPTSLKLNQFWPKGRPVIPKLIHRWLSPRVLAYWYMYGGYRTSSGDILLKLKGGTREDVEKIVMVLKAKSLDCRVKRKGRVFWIGFLGSNSVWFWKLTELYILDDLRELLRADVQDLGNDGAEIQDINFDSGSDSDEKASDGSDNENE
ncbi:hypothetical protein IFM89_017191 [Coptis chinensis]|uniref:Homing endonuclease LAGLIDADG domain-containing protein n=1 Tax=Coptis chinensis TaxID=261450 RepID=A0A835M9Z8_9MAGN|nr:hypothetical protein IFM89_017191 [Coptis chinensis]